MTGPAAPAATAALLAGGTDQVRALLDGHGLAAAAAVAYLSFADPASCIAAYDRDGRLTPLIDFLPLPTQGAALCEAIAAIDENGPRLVANFRRAFPADADRLSGFDAEVSIADSAAPGWLFAACSLALGMAERDVRAALAPGIEPVGLDTFVIESGERFVLDSRRLLRSVMSYRIGGVPRHVLARSIFESLGAFTASAIIRLLREWEAGAVVLAGDLFERNVILRERALQGLACLALPVACAGLAETVRPAGPAGVGPGVGGRGPVPLRLITPRAGWPNPGQRSASADQQRS